MWSLDFPLALIGLLLLLLLVYLAHFRRARGGKLSFNFGVWGRDHFRHGTTWRGLLLLGTRILFWSGFAVLILALAGPVLIEKKRSYLTRGLDLVVCLDVSPSMSARDVGSISRFDAARDVIRGFIQGRENDAIGLVIFGKEAALKAPPTLDTRFVVQALDSLEVMELGDGTAIGTGLAVSALHLKDSGSTEKLIILVTDGDNNAGQIAPEKAALVAAGLGIRIYTIGIGSEGETTIEFTDPESGKQVRGIYQGKLNEELLKQIAAATGGRYFHSGTLGILDTVFREIDGLERTRTEVAVFVQRKPRHATFIVIGFSLILACVLLNKLLAGELL